MDGRRWSSYQPNVSGRGIVAGYSARFWAIVVVLGAVTGAIAAGMVELLRLVEHVAYGYRRGPFLDGVAASVGWRHFTALMAAAVIVIVGGSCSAARGDRRRPRCRRRCGCRRGGCRWPRASCAGCWRS